MNHSESVSRSAWIDEARRVISFLPQKGFQELQFSSHQEMFRYVISLGFSGYGIL